MCIETKKQWSSSPHTLARHGESHDTLQWLRQLNGLAMADKLDSDSPIYMY